MRDQLKLILFALLLLFVAAPAYANLTITPTFDSSITSDPNALAIEGVINSAINFYQSTFADPITVAINFSEMTSGLGQSSTFFANVGYATYLAALRADAKDATDATATGLLPNSATNPVNGSATINVKTANLRAVGINANPPSGQPDGSIGLNTHITDVGSPGTSGTYSLFATVEHEIDEVLGLGSALASPPFGTIFPEDLYRYDASGNRSFTTNSSAHAFFSINRTDDLAQFDNQNDGGDFGDWQSNPLPGGVGPKVQDAFASPGAHPVLTLSSPEVIALDAIGYDLVSPVPEPTSVVLLGSILGLTVVALRRRNGQTTA
jgi:hypothetical protein